MAKMMEKNNIAMPEVQPQSEKRTYNDQRNFRNDRYEKNNRYEKKDRYDRYDNRNNNRGKNWRSYDRRDNRGYRQGRQQYSNQRPQYYMQAVQPQVVTAMPTQTVMATAAQPAPQGTGAAVIPQIDQQQVHQQLTVPVQHVTYQQPPQVLITPAEPEGDESITTGEETDE